MKEDNPRVFVPPPLIYVACFLVALQLQKRITIDASLLQSPFTHGLGFALVLVAALFLSRSFVQFFRSRNTVITIRPARSLETSGIYRITRNPMYVGLTLAYLGVTCLIGNWWNLILLPTLVLMVQEYVIKREERYLERRFGPAYLAYKARVRRWL